jgi:predicted TIM-barrel fold metal-dependent hydrolase
MVSIDAQVHPWGADTPERPWLPDEAAHAHRTVPLGKDELLREMGATGVDWVVIAPPSGGALGPALEPLLAAARHPNVAVKASALPCYSTEPYPLRNLHQYIRRVVDAYGRRRVFWGTDLTRLPLPPGGDALH